MTWTLAPRDAPWQALADRIDPYLAIAWVTGFDDHTEASGLRPATVGARIQWQLQNGGNDLRKLLARYPSSRLCKAHLDAGHRFATADLDLDALAALMSAKEFEIGLAETLRAVRVGRRTRAAPTRVERPKPVECPDNLLLACIDHGCPFAHADLLRADGSTRVHAIWDQDPHPDFPAELAVRPAGFEYGAVLAHARLQKLIDQAGTPIDEASCYAAAGYDALRTRASHGAHLLGLLAGARASRSLVDSRLDPPEPDFASRARVVFVQLPRAVLQAPYGPSVERAIVDGIQWVLGHAKSGMRVVVAVAYGHYLGPHDSSSWAERAIAAQVRAAQAAGIKLHVVFASGNGRLERTHVRTHPLSPGEFSRVHWVVPPANGVATHAELWTREPLHQWRIEITPPGASPLVIEAPGIWTFDAGSGPIAAVVARDHPDGAQVLLRSASTAPGGEGLMTGASIRPRPVGRPGRWRIDCIAGSGGAARADLYAAFGHNNLGFVPRSQQAFLVPETRCDDEGASMLVGTACGQGNWLIGGYVRSLRQPARYSASGPSRGGLRGDFNIDALAVSDESPALPGVAGIGHLSRSSVRIAGTSVAVPQAARELAQIDALQPRFDSEPGLPAVRLAPGPMQGEKQAIHRFLAYWACASTTAEREGAMSASCSTPGSTPGRNASS